MPNPYKIICALSLMLTLNACAKATDLGVSDRDIQRFGIIQKLRLASFCDVAQPLRWSAYDTDNTIKQVKLHNQAGIKLCKWH